MQQDSRGCRPVIRAGRRRRRAVERKDRGPVSHVDDCKKFIQCLSEHFDGELGAELEVEFMLHIEHCEKAQALLHTFERTIILH